MKTCQFCQTEQDTANSHCISCGAVLFTKGEKFFTHNQKNININKTCLQGYVNTSYKNLVKKLGQPTDGDGYKIDAEWDIEFPNGEVGTIYNWKDGHNYNDGMGMDVKYIKNWNIGGHSPKVVSLIGDLLGCNTVEDCQVSWYVI